jgi:hypothetical protein
MWVAWQQMTQDQHTKLKPGSSCKSSIEQEKESLSPENWTWIYIWSKAHYGAETWTFREVDQKYVEIFEGEDQLGRSWVNEEVLHRVKEKRNLYIE